MKRLPATCVILAMILVSGCKKTGSRAEMDACAPAQNAAPLTEARQSENNAGKTEAAQDKSRAEHRRKMFTTRLVIDRTAYGQNEFREIEDLYQSANKRLNSEEARKSLNKLVEKYPKSNRAGCAMLYMAQRTDGEERTEYLQRAIDEHGDCWYGDGVQVGAYARFHMAWDCLNSGKTKEANILFTELREQYPDAVDHQGNPLLDRIPKPANADVKSDAGKSAAKTATAPTHSAPCYDGGISGTVRDDTPDYSESKFRCFERIVDQALGDRNTDNIGRAEDDSIIKALTELLKPRGPISNVPVTLRPKSATPGSRGFPLETVTDSKGEFSFPGMPQGEYVVTAGIRRGWLAGRTEVRWQFEHYRRNETVRIVYHSKPATVTGKITDTSGCPLASVKVTATEDNDDRDYGDYTPQTHVVSGVSDRNGIYELRGLLPGNAYSRAEDYKIRAEIEGRVPAEMKVPVITEETIKASERLFKILMRNQSGETTNRLAEWKAKLPACNGNTITGMNFTLGSSAHISGKVVDGQGKTLPQCYVRLVAPDDAPESAAKNAVLPGFAYTDAQGAFEIGDVPAGSYFFRLGRDNRYVETAPERILINEGEARSGIQLVFDIQPLGRIEATLCEKTTGIPVTNFSCSWKVANSREMASSKGELRKNHSGPGAFTLENILPGDAELKITAPGFAAERLHIDVAPGQTTPLRAQMERGGAVRIRGVRDGSPIKLIGVFNVLSLGTGAETTEYSSPDAEAWYEIPNLKSGRHKIRVSVSGQYREWCSRETALVIVESCKTNEVTLDLSGGGGLALSLEFPSGFKAHARIEDADAPSYQPPEAGKNADMRAYLYTDRPGDYELKHLPPGTYRIHAELTEPPKGMTPKTELPPRQSQTLVVRNGLTSSVHFSFSAP